MRWWPLVLAATLGLAWHGLLLWGLDLHDLPGPGGVLLARDLLLGQHGQGPASWFASPGMVLGVVPALRLLGLASLGAAMAGAGLAAAALAGRRAAPWAMVLTASWAAVVHQALLVDAGGPAWGLAWLGLGLGWWGCTRRCPGWAGLGAGLLALGVATKASALPVLVLLPLGPWLRRLGRDGSSGAEGAERWALAAASLCGLGLGAGLGWALQGAEQPWLNPQAVGGEGGGWFSAVLALGQRGAVQGSFPVVIGLASLGAVAAFRRQPLVLAVLALTVLAMASVGEARAERLQPRHLLPVSIGLVALVASLGAWSRPRWAAPLGLVLLVGVAGLDGLGFASAFSAQREHHAQTAPARLPHGPAILGSRYLELPWVVFFESSLVGVTELIALPEAGLAGVASPSYQERRDVHLEVASTLLGVPYRRLGADRCCTRDQPLESCAAGVVRQLDAAGALLVLPGKLEVVAPEDRDFARALEGALGARSGRPARWRVVRGSGAGAELPCRVGR